MIRWFEHRQVYGPRKNIEASPADFGCAFEDVVFSSSDGVSLHGWFLPAVPGARRQNRVLLLCHGNVGNISGRLNFIRAWLELGLAVFVFDYRGYGRSAGRADEPGTYADARAAWRWLRARGYAPADIVVLGKSLGGGIASELVLHEPPGALILQSTFTNIPDLGCELFPWLPVRRWNTIRYDTIARLPKIQVPLLIAHSRNDDLISYRHAERNFAAANTPKELLEIAGRHVSVIEDGRAAYLEGLGGFLDRHGF